MNKILRFIIVIVILGVAFWAIMNYLDNQATDTSVLDQPIIEIEVDETKTPSEKVGEYTDKIKDSQDKLEKALDEEKNDELSFINLFIPSAFADDGEIVDEAIPEVVEEVVEESSLDEISELITEIEIYTDLAMEAASEVTDPEVATELLEEIQEAQEETSEIIENAIDEVNDDDVFEVLEDAAEEIANAIEEVEIVANEVKEAIEAGIVKIDIKVGQYEQREEDRLALKTAIKSGDKDAVIEARSMIRENRNTARVLRKEAIEKRVLDRINDLPEEVKTLAIERHDQRLQAQKEFREKRISIAEERSEDRAVLKEAIQTGDKEEITEVRSMIRENTKERNVERRTAITNRHEQYKTIVEKKLENATEEEKERIENRVEATKERNVERVEKRTEIRTEVREDRTNLREAVEAGDEDGIRQGDPIMQNNEEAKKIELKKIELKKRELRNDQLGTKPMLQR